MQDSPYQENQPPCQNENKNGEENMKIDPTKNTIVCGDNLSWLNDVPDESIDLCYIDPPFFSNADYEKVWGNGWEVASFGDRFKGGINHYIEWMRPRIELISKKLKPTGSIFLHCDYHASHRLRCLLDDVFKPNNFRNEIIWHYNTFHGRNDKESIPIKHDVIFWYSKTNDFKYNAKYDSSFDELVDYKRWKKYFNNEGDILGNNMPLNDTRFMRYLNKFIKLNKRQPTAKDVIYSLTGQAQDDVWDIPHIDPKDTKEKIGYKTQKPEYLVYEILSIASNENDVILDCFAGGFTTAKVCVDTNRRFICGDVSPVACKVGAKRLNKMDFIDYEIKGMYQTEEEFRNMNPHDFADMICDLMGWKANPKKTGDGGIDGWDGNGNPVQIKNWRRNAGAHDLRDFKGALEHHKTGIFVNWGFVVGKTGVYEYIQEQKNKHGINIEVRTCADLIGDLLIAKEKREQIEQFYEQNTPIEWNELPPEQIYDQAS